MKDRRSRTTRLWAAAALFAVVVAACSGSDTASDVANGRTPAPGETPGTTDLGISPESDDGGDDGGSAGPDTGTSGGGTSSAGGGGDGGNATVSDPGEEPQVQQDEGGSGVPSANLFTAEENRVGITDEKLTLCMHAAFVLGDVFNNEQEDEDVYWRMVNANGGIAGREVEIHFEDDAYSPDQAVEAANACKERDSFLILSGVGFDQIPRVRQWAENNRQLYLHSMATEEGAQGKQFSFAVAPTLQMVGKQIAQFVLKEHPNKKYAAVSRNSPNWDGALKAFEDELKARGSELVYKQKVDSGQDYNIVISELSSACPEDECLVFANENVLNFSKLYQQANNPPHNYRPLWFNYGFQLTNDTIGESTANDPPVEAWYPTPAYDPTNSTDQPWWPEIQRMKEAYAEYCTGECDKDPEELNDVDWQFWLAFKSLHRFLEDCMGNDGDCTRNRMVGLMLNGYKTTVDPLCEADFSRGGVTLPDSNHFGAHAANIYRAVKYPDGSVWDQIRTCRESFL